MTLEQSLIEVVRSLPPEKQQALLQHAHQLREQADEPKKPLKSIRGLWADLGISLSAEEIDEARREMWGNFPRDDF